MSSSSSSSNETDTQSDVSEDNEKFVEDEYGLKIKMNDRAETRSPSYPARRQAEPSSSQSVRFQRSRAQSPEMNRMTPSSTVERNAGQLGYTIQSGCPADNALSSARLPSTRRPTANSSTPRTSQVRVEIPSTRRSAGYAPCFPSLEADINATYDPVRDPRHWCHNNCDVPLPSTEPACERQERAKLRVKRRHEDNRAYPA
jgi:hypothetical protein